MPTSCFQYLKYHVPYNTWFGLPFYTKAHLFKTSKYKLVLAEAYSYLTELVWVLGIMFALYLVPSTHDVELLCGILSPTIFTIHSLLKAIHFNIFKSEYTQHLNELEISIENYKSFNIPNHNVTFDDFFQSKSRRNRLTLKYLLSFQFFTSWFFCGPFFIKIFMEPPSGWSLQVPMYIPLDLSSGFNYFITMVFQTVYLCMMNLKGIVLDLFAMDMILINYVQFEYLNEVLVRLISAYENDLISTSDADINIKLWIKQHQQIRKCSSVMQMLVRSYILLEYSEVVTVVCLTIIYAMSDSTWDLNQQITSLGAVFNLILLLYLFTINGSQLAYSFDSIEKTFYGFSLISWKQLGYIFRMYCATNQKPNYITYRSVYPLCYSTFTVILKLVITYYLALSEIQNMKKH